METNQITTITYEHPAESPEATGAASEWTERGKLRRIPVLAWAAAATFALNILVVLGIIFSPNLPVTMYGRVQASEPILDRPSPFTEIVSTRPVRIRQAARIVPVLEQQPAVMDAVQPVAFDMPRATQPSIRPAVYSSPAPQATQLNIPRVTAALLPQSAGTGTSGAMDVTPKRSSERERTSLIN